MYGLVSGVDFYYTSNWESLPDWGPYLNLFQVIALPKITIELASEANESDIIG